MEGCREALRQLEAATERLPWVYRGNREPRAKSSEAALLTSESSQYVRYQIGVQRLATDHGRLRVKTSKIKPNSATPQAMR